MWVISTVHDVFWEKPLATHLSKVVSFLTFQLTWWFYKRRLVIWLMIKTPTSSNNFLLSLPCQLNFCFYCEFVHINELWVIYFKITLKRYYFSPLKFWKLTSRNSCFEIYFRFVIRLGRNCILKMNDIHAIWYFGPLNGIREGALRLDDFLNCECR